jgi:hypothetical protein
LLEDEVERTQSMLIVGRFRRAPLDLAAYPSIASVNH